MRGDAAAVADRDAGRLLAAVLQRVEREVGQPRDVAVGRVDAEDAAHQRGHRLRDGGGVRGLGGGRDATSMRASAAGDPRCGPSAGDGADAARRPAAASRAASSAGRARRRPRPTRPRRTASRRRGRPRSGSSTSQPSPNADSAMVTARPPSETSWRRAQDAARGRRRRARCRAARWRPRLRSAMRPSTRPCTRALVLGAVQRRHAGGEQQHDVAGGLEPAADARATRSRARPGSRRSGVGGMGVSEVSL